MRPEILSLRDPMEIMDMTAVDKVCRQLIDGNLNELIDEVLEFKEDEYPLGHTATHDHSFVVFRAGNVAYREVPRRMLLSNPNVEPTDALRGRTIRLPEDKEYIIFTGKSESGRPTINGILVVRES